MTPESDCRLLYENEPSAYCSAKKSISSYSVSVCLFRRLTSAYESMPTYTLFSPSGFLSAAVFIVSNAKREKKHITTAITTMNICLKIFAVE